MLQQLPHLALTAREQRRRNDRNHVLGYVAVLATGLVIGLAGYGSSADPFSFAFAMLVFGAAAILIRPILGVYLTLFFVLIGDGPTIHWFPFALNLSSEESILYVHDALTFTPIEIYLSVTVVSWIAHVAGARQWRLSGSPVLWPLMIFAGLVVIGVLYGVGVRGGSLTVAIWEVRPILYIPVMFVLVSNLFTRTKHYVCLAATAVGAISIQNVLAIQHYNALPRGERELMEGLTEHAAAVHYDWLFMLLLALCLFGGSRRARILVAIAAIPTVYVFVLSQRRAAVIALVAGFLAFSLVLYVRRRSAFMVMMPIVGVMTAMYTAAFWNATGGVGFGARAIKSVIATDQVSERDASSNVYRAIENYNLVFTVRSEPLMGVGFGMPFYQPWPLPDLSFFVFYEYIPHNSIVWIWLKAGYLGFVMLLFVIAVTLRAGIGAALRLPFGNGLAVTVGALTYVVMYLVFAYVDIAWDPRSTLFLAVCMATCVNMVRLHEDESGVRARGSSP